MNWTDTAIVLRLNKIGEYDAVCTVLSKHHGKVNGVVKGAFSKKMRTHLELGSVIMATYKSKTADDLGYFQIEPVKNNSSTVLNHSGKLQAFKSALSLVDASLMYGQNHDNVYTVLESLFITLASEHWATSYCKWEISILAEMGVALDFTECAGGGDNNDLCYVSPKSGRSVSREMGQIYKSKLLPLPEFLTNPEKHQNTGEDYFNSMKMTGHFLSQIITDYNKDNMVEPRKMLSDWFFKRFDKVI